MQPIFVAMRNRLKIWFNNSLVIMLALLLMNYCIPYNSMTEITHLNRSKEATVFSPSNYNEIESVFELITEEWMDMENFVPEPESDDAPEDIAKVKTLFRLELPAISIEPLLFYPIVQYQLFNNSCITAYHTNIPTPPPDIA